MPRDERRMEQLSDETGLEQVPFYSPSRRVSKVARGSKREECTKDLDDQFGEEMMKREWTSSD